MFDPYYKWLGIPPKDQPPNHYRLLGIELFESDADVIDAAANKQMAYIQGCATGPHIALSQRLLNEIAAARLCLLTPAKKATYDAKLKASVPSVPLAKPIVTAASVSSQQAAITADSPAPISPKPSQDAPNLFEALEGEPDVGILKRRKHRSKTWPVILGCAILGVIASIVVGVYSLGGPNATKTDKPHAKDAKTLPRPKMKDDKENDTPPPKQLKERWNHVDLSTVEVLDDFVRLSPGKQMRTKESYSGPIEVVVIARTKKHNIRLHAFNGARLIFNWEQRQGEFRVHRPDTTLAAAQNQPLDPNTWYTIRWRITEHDMDVSVNGERVFSETRAYDLSNKQPVAVVSIESVVEVKSLDVRPLKTPNQDVSDKDKSKSDKKAEVVKNPEIHQWVDLLKLVKLPDTALRGVAVLDAGNLVLQEAAQVELPVSAAGNYDLEISFTRIKGGDTVSIIMPVAGQSCQFWMDFFGEVGGLSTKENIDPRFNMATVKPKRLENGKKHTLAIQVRTLEDSRASLKAMLNNDTYLVWEGNSSQLTTSHLWKQPSIGAIAIGVGSGSTVQFHSIRMRTIHPNPKDEKPEPPEKTKQVITLNLLKKKLHGTVTFDSKTGLLTLAYDFSDKRQLKDFSADTSKLVTNRKKLVLQAGESTKHVVKFSEVTVSAVVYVPTMKGILAATTEGTKFSMGGANPDTMYLETANPRGRTQFIVPDKERTGAIPVRLTVLPHRAAFDYGQRKLGLSTKEAKAGHFELFGGDVGYTFGQLRFTGKLDSDWADKFFTDP